MKRRVLYLVLGILFTTLVRNDQAAAYITVKSNSIRVGGMPVGTMVMTVDIPVGLHFFALPGEPVESWTASFLSEAVRKNGVSLKYIKRFNAKGAFETFGLVPDFNLEVGRGYLIESAKACKISITVKALRNTLTVNLKKGPNLISVPKGGPYTAATLLADLQKQGVKTPYVLKVNGGILDLYYPPFITRDFAVEAGKSYLVASSKDMPWMAHFVTPKSAFSTAKTPAAVQLEKAVAAQLALPDSNRAPVVLPLNRQTLSKRVGAYQLQLIAWDMDGNPLKYSAQPLPKGFSLDQSTGIFRWSVAQTGLGNYRIEFRVTDGNKTTATVGIFDIVK